MRFRRPGFPGGGGLRVTGHRRSSRHLGKAWTPPRRALHPARLAARLGTWSWVARETSVLNECKCYPRARALRARRTGSKTHTLTNTKTKTKTFYIHVVHTCTQLRFYYTCTQLFTCTVLQDRSVLVLVCVLVLVLVCVVSKVAVSSAYRLFVPTLNWRTGLQSIAFLLRAHQLRVSSRAGLGYPSVGRSSAGHGGPEM